MTPVTTFPSGDRYEGGYRDGKRQGRGIYRFTSGSMYEGDWFDGKKHGKGTYFSADGSRFEGSWVNDKRVGYGVSYYYDGDVYEGEWFNNVRHGIGTYTFGETGIKYYGTWIEGRRVTDESTVGAGTHAQGYPPVLLVTAVTTFPCGAAYEGGYRDGKRQGRGIYRFTSGSMYEGNWFDGKKHGKGTYFSVDGSRFEGSWVNDQRVGYGVCYYYNGDVYEGEWFNNVRHGIGTYTYGESGVKYYGTWIEGKRVTDEIYANPGFAGIKKDVPKKVLLKDARAERIRRNHLNDLANISTVLFVGLLYAFFEPTGATAVALRLFRFFIISRIMNAICYQVPLPQPSMALFFIVGLLVCTSMAFQMLTKIN